MNMGLALTHLNSQHYTRRKSDMGSFVVEEMVLPDTTV